MRLRLAAAILLLILPGVGLADLAWLPARGAGAITLIGLEPMRMVRTFAFEPALGQRFDSAVLSQDNRTLLLVDGSLNRVVGVDLRDERSHWSVDVPEGPEAVWLSPDGRQLAVCAERAGKVVFIDVVERRLVGSIRIQTPPPEDCAFSPDGRWLAVSERGAARVSVVDLHDGKLQRRIATGGQPAGMTFIGGELWLAVPDRHRVEIIDAHTWKSGGAVQAGLRPVAIAASPDGGMVYVANRDSETVSMIDRRQRRVIRSAPAGPAPSHLALSADGRRLLVSSRAEASTLLLEAPHLRPVGRVRLPHQPLGAAPSRTS
jgi:YVTN family beta-propeller protein